MKKELKDYAHLYIGCKMIFEKSGRIATLYGVKEEALDEDDCRLVLHDDSGWKVHEYWNYKLILRSLVDMDDETARKYGWGSAEHFKISTEFHRIGRGGTLRLYPDETKFLLSEGFDLYDLIEAGIAVDKNNIE